MLKRKFAYEISGLHHTEGDELGPFGFSVYLDRKIAKKAFLEKISDKGYDNFQEDAKLIIKDCGLIDEGKEVYQFVEDDKRKLTFLLYCIQIPGSIWNLGMDLYELSGLNKKTDRNWIEYHSHNVDNIRQAYALLSLFTHWANEISSL